MNKGFSIQQGNGRLGPIEKKNPRYIYTFSQIKTENIFVECVKWDIGFRLIHTVKSLHYILFLQVKYIALKV